MGLNPALYPTLDRQPAVDSPEVLQWISEINLAGAPRIAVNGLNGCQNTTINAAAVANASSTGNCELGFLFEMMRVNEEEEERGMVG